MSAKAEALKKAAERQSAEAVEARVALLIDLDAEGVATYEEIVEMNEIARARIFAKHPKNAHHPLLRGSK